MVTDLGRGSEKSSIPNLHSVRWQTTTVRGRNIEARVNTFDDISTSDRNLVNYSPVFPEFCRRVCAGQATYTLGFA